MAYLNANERQKLLDELKRMRFNQAKHKLIRMDPKGRLVYYRNNQGTNKWMTRIDLVSYGTRVTLVEENRLQEKNGKTYAEFELTEIIVEPTPDNRS